MLCLKFAVASFPRFVLLGIDFASPAVMSKLEIFANELVTAGEKNRSLQESTRLSRHEFEMLHTRIIIDLTYKKKKLN